MAASSTTAGASTTVASTVIATTTAQPSDDVSVAVSWTYTSGVTSVKMQITNLKASQWCAFGLSLDQDMVKEKE